MHVSMHANPDRSIVVEAIDPSNSERVTLRDPQGSTMTMFLHSRDALRMIAGALPLAPDCSLYLGNARIEDQARILRWIAGEGEQTEDPTQHPRMSTVHAVPELPPLSPCNDCGAQWQDKTLLRGPDRTKTGAWVACCGTCGYDADRHQPVIWQDGEAAQ
jgi:hypothetical protein